MPTILSATTLCWAAALIEMNIDRDKKYLNICVKSIADLLLKTLNFTLIVVPGVSEGSHIAERRSLTLLRRDSG
jgi:hypothetical protein